VNWEGGDWAGDIFFVTDGQKRDYLSRGALLREARLKIGADRPCGF